MSAKTDPASARHATEPSSENHRRRASITLFRRSLQILFLLLVLVIGVQFVLFVNTSLKPGGPYISRPAGVGAFLPIAGLMGLRHWFETGRLDNVQPSAAVFLLLAVLLSVLFKKSFCSWVCPFGTLSEYLWRLRSWITPGWARHRVPRWLDAVFMAPKYILLAFFAGFIALMPLSAVGNFIHSPYNRLVDVRMLLFFEHPSRLVLGVLLGLLLLSFLVKNAWCRYFCPYGALLGLAGLVSPAKVKRYEAACTGCGACTRACPMHLKVHELGTVRSPECTSCLLCLDACPVEDALAAGPTRSWNRMRTGLAAAALVLLVILGGIGLARATGHWRNGMTQAQYRQEIPRVAGRETGGRR